ncbi:unnamed protein product [Vitrella brassicaformis CCMP3155]|uniref:Uncharacterized protein n=3 Tax=Vitrella brassicaformis TaxID=1169539 RepID=A0A0G4FYM4_VITBC|nr:unnamed protein product [Vitrella brassicaformis CCMP3155]|eukprot:CEM20475.1 unnamed protein product [Vitrella brassicaformis CCMP3155]
MPSTTNLHLYSSRWRVVGLARITIMKDTRHGSPAEPQDSTSGRRTAPDDHHQGSCTTPARQERQTQPPAAGAAAAAAGAGGGAADPTTKASAFLERCFPVVRRIIHFFTVLGYLVEMAVLLGVFITGLLIPLWLELVLALLSLPYALIVASGCIMLTMTVLNIGSLLFAAYLDDNSPLAAPPKRPAKRKEPPAESADANGATALAKASQIEAEEDGNSAAADEEQRRATRRRQRKRSTSFFGSGWSCWTLFLTTLLRIPSALATCTAALAVLVLISDHRHLPATSPSPSVLCGSPPHSTPLSPTTFDRPLWLYTTWYHQAHDDLLGICVPQEVFNVLNCTKDEPVRDEQGELNAGRLRGMVYGAFSEELGKGVGRIPTNAFVQQYRRSLDGYNVTTERIQQFLTLAKIAETRLHCAGVCEPSPPIFIGNTIFDVNTALAACVPQFEHYLVTKSPLRPLALLLLFCGLIMATSQQLCLGLAIYIAVKVCLRRRQKGLAKKRAGVTTAVVKAKPQTPGATATASAVASDKRPVEVHLDLVVRFPDETQSPDDGEGEEGSSYPNTEQREGEGEGSAEGDDGWADELADDESDHRKPSPLLRPALEGVSVSTGTQADVAKSECGQGGKEEHETQVEMDQAVSTASSRHEGEHTHQTDEQDETTTHTVTSLPSPPSPPLTNITHQQPTPTTIPHRPSPPSIFSVSSATSSSYLGSQAETLAGFSDMLEEPIQSYLSKPRARSENGDDGGRKTTSTPRHRSPSLDPKATQGATRQQHQQQQQQQRALFRDLAPSDLQGGHSPLDCTGRQSDTGTVGGLTALFDEPVDTYINSVEERRRLRSLTPVTAGSSRHRSSTDGRVQTGAAATTPTASNDKSELRRPERRQRHSGRRAAPDAQPASQPEGREMSRPEGREALHRHSHRRRRHDRGREGREHHVEAVSFPPSLSVPPRRPLRVGREHASSAERAQTPN